MRSRPLALAALALVPLCADAQIVLDPTYGDGGLARVGATRTVPVRFVGYAVLDGPNGSTIVGGVSGGDWPEGAEGTTGIPTLVRVRADGTLDPAFGVGGLRRDTLAGDLLLALARDPAGRIVAVGNDVLGYQPPAGACDPPEVWSDLLVVRYTADGARDRTFGVDGLRRIRVNRPLPAPPQRARRTGCGAAATVKDVARSVAVDGAGRIVLGGSSHEYYGTRYGVVVRLLPDGTPDPAFGTNGIAVLAPATLTAADAVAVAPGGRVVAVGPSSGGAAVVALGDDGRLDPAFGVRGRVAVPMPSAYAVAADPLGRVVVAGGGGPAGLALARYGPGGAPDSSFGRAGLVEADLVAGREQARALALEPDGGVVAAGDGTTDLRRPLFVRLSAAGEVVARRVLAGDAVRGAAFAVRPAPDGVRVAGSVEAALAAFAGRFAPGTLDGPLAVVPLTGPYDMRDEVHGLAVTTDGRAVVAGQSDLDGLLVGFTPGGARDPEFRPSEDRLVGFSVRLGPLLVRPGGALLVGGALDPQSIRRPAAFELDRTGRVGRVFSFDVPASYEGATALGQGTDGQVVVGAALAPFLGAGRPGAFVVARFRSDGTRDGTFGTDGVATVRFPAAPYGSTHHLPSLAEPLADGRVLVGGRIDDGFGFARLLADGRVDPAYADSGRLAGPAGFAFAAAARLPSGALAVLSRDAGHNLMLLRYTPEGQPDPAFGSGGRVFLGGTLPHSRGALLALPSPDGRTDGPLLVGGALGEGLGARYVVLRVRPDGTVEPDALSGPAGAYGAVVAFAPTKEGDVLALVQTSAFGPDGYVVRLRGVYATAADAPAAPHETALGVPFPNPTRGPVVVRFALDRPGPARLTIHDVLGREVAVVADGPHAAGPHEGALDASALTPGIYFVRLSAGGRSVTRPLTVVR